MVCEWFSQILQKKDHTYFRNVSTSDFLSFLCLNHGQTLFLVEEYRHKKILTRQFTHLRLIFINICCTCMFGMRNSRFQPKITFIRQFYFIFVSNAKWWTNASKKKLWWVLLAHQNFLCWKRSSTKQVIQLLVT